MPEARYHLNLLVREFRNHLAERTVRKWAPLANVLDEDMLKIGFSAFHLKWTPELGPGIAEVKV